MNINSTGASWCWSHLILAVAPANGAAMLRGGKRQFGRMKQQVCLPDISGEAAAGKYHQVSCRGHAGVNNLYGKNKKKRGAVNIVSTLSSKKRTSSCNFP